MTYIHPVYNIVKNIDQLGGNRGQRKPEKKPANALIPQIRFITLQNNLLWATKTITSILPQTRTAIVPPVR